MLKKYLSAAILAVLLLESSPVFADHHWGGDRRWGHGYVARRLPPGYVALTVSGLSYLYCEGLFYRHTPVGYVIVEPPLGAVVPVLPPGYTTVVVQRTPYYYYEDTYYATAPNGYVVAAPPAVAAVPTPAPAAPPIQPQVSATTKTEYKDTIDTYDIYIPNENGSYTLVTLKKVEKGFVGPQGEFYPEHPTVEKLKMLYGKK